MDNYIDNLLEYYFNQGIISPDEFEQRVQEHKEKELSNPESAPSKLEQLKKENAELKEQLEGLETFQADTNTTLLELMETILLP